MTVSWEYFHPQFYLGHLDASIIILPVSLVILFSADNAKISDILPKLQKVARKSFPTVTTLQFAPICHLLQSTMSFSTTWDNFIPHRAFGWASVSLIACNSLLFCIAFYFQQRAAFQTAKYLFILRYSHCCVCYTLVYWSVAGRYWREPGEGIAARPS